MGEGIEQALPAISNYVVERELGRGGMATVYLAHDAKHDRKVAVKILRAELAALVGAERFLLEIRVTATLQHPHILGLLDSGVLGPDAGEWAGRPYYVMPFVDGESLGERLKQEGQLPVGDAIRIATEVASALDYAHRRGVIHRDIKPDNILLQDGSAVVADFGIALALGQVRTERLTETGLSLGTPEYMSPEQAAGERTITARSDIYALGAVLYEMLAGVPPFTGASARAVVARVISQAPEPLAAHRSSAPPHVAAAVMRALEKTPADRFASAREFSEAFNDRSFKTSRATSSRFPVTGQARYWLAAAVVLAILTAAFATWGRRGPTANAQVLRYTLSFDSSESLSEGVTYGDRITLSPDGTQLAYIGGPLAQVLIRPRNLMHATPLTGSEGAMTPAYAPDGRHVAFVQGRSLQVSSLDGGPPVTVTRALVGEAGLSWGTDGYIYADGDGHVSLLRIEPKAGGVAKWFTTLDTASGETDHLWPEALPNARGVLFTVAYAGRDAVRDRLTYAVAVADASTGKHRVLVTDATHPRYASAGYLLYVTTARTLMAVPFDQQSMRITGEPTAVSEQMRFGSIGEADVTVSTTGTLVYSTGSEQGGQELAWVTRDGRAQEVDSAWRGRFAAPALSPDGSRLAVVMYTDQTADIWVRKVDQGPSVRLTLEGNQNLFTTWTPDGKSVTFSSNVSGSTDLWTRRADGSAQAVLQLHRSSSSTDPLWSPDGAWLLFRASTQAPVTRSILAVRPGADTTAVPMVSNGHDALLPSLSPDGRWMAYVSDETGQDEVYVVPFPHTGDAKWAVSTGGGTQPLWSRAGGELFYRDRRGNLVSVAVATKPTFSLGRSTVLFPAGGFALEERRRSYDVTPDGKRFLMIRPHPASASDRMNVVENWFEEVRAKRRQ